MRRKSVEELKELKQAGLTLAYTGLESGDPVILERIKKGLTPEQAVKGMAKAKAAGIDILVSIIFGIGGKERSREHIVETTRLLNIMKPEQIAPITRYMFSWDFLITDAFFCKRTTGFRF